MAKDGTLDGLIVELSADLQPVRRLRPPVWRAAAWLGLLVLTGVVLATFADVPGIAHRLMAAPDMWLAVLGSSMTAILGAVAVFQLCVPGREASWALLPIPGLILWVAASGVGCLRTWIIPQTHDASLDEAKVCLMFIVGVSIPLSAVMTLMIRRACPLRPSLTAAVGGLAIAAGAATLLNFFHPYDATATDLTVHLVAVAIVVMVNEALGGSNCFRSVGMPSYRAERLTPTRDEF